VTIRNFTGAVKTGDLLLLGLCSECRGDVASVVEMGRIGHFSDVQRQPSPWSDEFNARLLQPDQVNVHLIDLHTGDHCQEICM
jgi:hypothetical protein